MVGRYLICDLELLEFPTGARGDSSDAATGLRGRDDHVLLVLGRGGPGGLSVAGRRLRLRPGAALTLDSRQAHDVVVDEPDSFHGLMLPRLALEERGLPVKVLAGLLYEDGSAARLLCAYLTALKPMLPDLSGLPMLSARNALLELVYGVLSGAKSTVHPPSVCKVTRPDVEHYIQRHLGERTLSPAGIAVALNISVRSLHRLFDSSGAESVGSYIRRTRLARALQDILAAKAPVTISEIAHRWGFADSSHFTRRFREQYHCLPRDLIDVDTVAAQRVKRLEILLPQSDQGLRGLAPAGVARAVDPSGTDVLSPA